MDELISPSHRYLTHMPTLAVCMRPQTLEKTLALAATPPIVTSYQLPKKPSPWLPVTNTRFRRPSESRNRALFDLRGSLTEPPDLEKIAVNMWLRCQYLTLRETW